jgi:uncharacterized membrane protein YhaH (DUF805 family)
MKWYLHALRNFNNFDGRASRTEYWMFFCFNIVFAVLFFTIDLIFHLGFNELGFGPFYILYAVISFFPGLALAVRRLHDVGKSGGYICLALIPLVSLYLIALFCSKGDEMTMAIHQ